MAFSTGFLKHRIVVQNRTKAKQGKFGLDSAGIEFETAGTVWAEVTWAKGKQALNAGALDVYGVKMIRMRWNTIVNERSRIVWHGKTYQIVGDTFNADRQGNTIQFLAQQIVNDK